MPKDVIAAIVGIWLPFWAIRRKAELDYKLNATAQILRWVVIAMCYALVFLPGVRLGPIRAACFIVGLTFLCWPNFAYHLARRFQNWPTTEGTVESAEKRSSSEWCVTYYFRSGGQTYGGTSTVKPIPGVGLKQAYPEGKILTIRYDPLNPGKSSNVAQDQKMVSG